MKIKTAEFIMSCSSLAQCPRDGLPEIACVGRSNVGKSSLVNALLHRKALAKVSRTPGKTRLLNYYRISTSDPTMRPFYLVDLPGYGYARVPQSLREDWGALTESYFAERHQLRAVLLLVDSRAPQKHDALTYQWLTSRGYQAVVVGTKIDKFSRGAWRGRAKAIGETLGLAAEEPVLLCSSVTGQGIDDLWRGVRSALLGSKDEEREGNN